MLLRQWAALRLLQVARVNRRRYAAWRFAAALTTTTTTTMTKTAETTTRVFFSVWLLFWPGQQADEDAATMQQQDVENHSPLLPPQW